MIVARLALGALAAASLASATLPQLGGVNLAGLDFGMTTWGWSGSYQAPDISQIAHFVNLKANVIRIPFGWQYMTPTIGGELDSSYFALLDARVQESLSLGAYVVLDLHNYGRVNSGVVGKDGPSNEQFASLWSKLAAKYATDSKVIFGLMNEPHDLADLTSWVSSVQAAVTAIRSAGATTQHILLPGNDWTHATSMVSTSGPALMAVTDSAGGTDKLVFDVHQYLDSDGSGTQSSCTTDNVALLTQLNSWLASVGRQALITETGVANNAECISKFKAQLSYIKGSSNIAGFTAWSAGAFDSSYVLSLTPGSDGSDNAIVTGALVPNFPAGSPTASGTTRRRRSPEVEARRATYKAYATKRRMAGQH